MCPLRSERESCSQYVANRISGFLKIGAGHQAGAWGCYGSRLRAAVSRAGRHNGLPCGLRTQATNLPLRRDNAGCFHWCVPKAKRESHGVSQFLKQPPSGSRRNLSGALRSVEPLPSSAGAVTRRTPSVCLLVTRGRARSANLDPTMSEHLRAYNSLWQVRSDSWCRLEESADRLTRRDTAGSGKRKMRARHAKTYWLG